MKTLRWEIVTGGLVLALVGGSVVWAVWPEEQKDWSSDCSQVLAVDEVEEFFGTSELSAEGRSRKLHGQKAAECSVRPDKRSDLRSLDIHSRPSAAYKPRGSEYRLGTPIGSGWTGSINSYEYYGTTATVLLDCKTQPGNGLLVVAETSVDAGQLSAHEETQVARAATETARQRGKQLKCGASMGSRVKNLRVEELRQVPLGKAEGACKGIISESVASKLKITKVSESPAGRTLTEACYLNRRFTRYGLKAFYGPQAKYEKISDGRNGIVPEETMTMSKACGGALGEGYFKLSPEVDISGNEHMLKEILNSFAEASTKRNKCSIG